MPLACRPRCGGIPTIPWHFFEVARLAFDHATAAIDRDLTALLEHVADLFAAALHS